MKKPKTTTRVNQLLALLAVASLITMSPLIYAATTEAQTVPEEEPETTTNTSRIFTPPTPGAGLAMSQPTPIPEPVQQIITQSYELCPDGAFPSDCILLDYANERMVKIRGDLLLQIVTGEARGDVLTNNLIWHVVNQIIDLGYNLDTVLLSGQGSQGNPHKWEILLMQ